MEYLIIFFVVFFIVLFLGLTGFWEWFWNEVKKPSRMRKELKDECNPIKDMCEFKSQERARLLQEWDKEYLAALPRLWETSKVNALIEQKERDNGETAREAELMRMLLRPSLFESQPTEEETDKFFAAQVETKAPNPKDYDNLNQYYWVFQSYLNKTRKYNARDHQSYY